MVLDKKTSLILLITGVIILIVMLTGFIGYQAIFSDSGKNNIDNPNRNQDDNLNDGNLDFMNSSGFNECNDSLDNDADGFTDYPADFGCTSFDDDSEINEGNTQCSDGIDNDGDGRIDQADIQCAGRTDDNEAPSAGGGGGGGGGSEDSACEDGIDNDGDGSADLADFGCVDSNDDSEINDGSTECSNGQDDDSDGFIDQDDTGCPSRGDDSESDFNPLAECNLNGAQWSRTNAEFGEGINLVINGEDCDGEIMNIFVYKESGGGSDIEVDRKEGITFTNTQTILGWTVNDGTGSTGFAFILSFMIGFPAVIYFAGRKIKLTKRKLIFVLVFLVILMLFVVCKTSSIFCNLSLSPEGSYYFVATLSDDSGSIQSNTLEVNVPVTICSDGIDNDADGWIDSNDPGCWTDRNNPSSYDSSLDSETGASSYQCSNELDDDDIQGIDGNDPDCTSWNDDSESSLEAGWVLLNDGNPVDAEFPGDSLRNPLPESSSSRMLGGDVSYLDSAGNLVYMYQSSDPDNVSVRLVRVARLTSDKFWQVLDKNGWKDVLDSPKFLGGGMKYVSRVSIFEDSNFPGEVRGFISSNPVIGLANVDLHESPYFFKLSDLGEDNYWTRSSFEEFNSQALLKNWAGSWGTNNGRGFDFDSSDNFGLLISNYRAHATANNFLVAAKYVSGEVPSSNWYNWFQGNWVDSYVNPVDWEYSSLPIIPLPGDLSQNTNPTVDNIPGTDDFIISYAYSQNSLSTGLYFAKFMGSTNEWLVWDGSDWSQNYESAYPLEEFSRAEFSRAVMARESFWLGNSFYILYDYQNAGSYGIQMIKYDSLSNSWTEEPLIEFDGDNISWRIRIYEDKIWLVARSGEDIVLSESTGGQFSEPVIVYSDPSSLPYDINFFQGKPVILFTKEDEYNNRRLYAVSENSDGFWNNQNIRGPAVFGTSLGELDFGQDVSQWDLTIYAYDETATSQNSFSNSLAFCPYMGLDSEENVYCSKSITFSLGIFPENYVSSGNEETETASLWGNSWDQFTLPNGVAIDNLRGKVYTTDNLWTSGAGNMMNHGRVQIWEKSWNDLDIGKGSSYAPVRFITFNGNRFNWPSDLVVDENNGFLYVTESAAGRIAKFDVENLQSGRPSFLEFIGEGNLDFPTGIEIDNSGNIYVMDSVADKLFKYSSSGVLVNSWGESGKDQGEFLYPFSLAVDKVKEYVYVADSVNQRIQVFDLDGNYVNGFSSWQSSLANPKVENLNYVSGLTANNNHLYVNVAYLDSNIEDYKRYTIVKFNMNLP